MYYVVQTPKRFEDAADDLRSAVESHGFGVLHVHDLGSTLRSKGVVFSEDCKVFEICNPRLAGEVLAVDMRLNMALPCRISVYTERGATRIGLIRPSPMLEDLSDDPRLREIAREVEEQARQMVDESR
ncbi:MAG: DUF302 domain-containing protein [Pseudomonadota bacterium]